MKLFFAFTFVVIFTSCASKKEIEGKKGSPEWINAPMTGCSDQIEICASAEGDGQLAADSNARTSLAQIFETKIESTTNINSLTKQDSTSSSISGGKSEFISTDLTEYTNQILEGVVIKERYKDSKKAYALASLDKIKASDRLRSQMKELDEKLVAFNKENKKSNFGKMRKLSLTRETLNSRYEFLMGMKVPSKVSFEDILSKKKIQMKADLVSITIDDQDFQPILQRLVTERGFKVIKDVAKANLDIEAKIETKKEYMNVDGFEKYSYTLTLMAKNEANEKVGSIEFKTSGMGRSQAQVKEKVKSDIENFIEEHFDELNLE